MEEKRKALINFCDQHKRCIDCPLRGEKHKCGRGYSFRCGVNEPGYIPDEEVEEAYKLAFPERVDSKSIKMLTDWCSTCINRKTCAIDEGFREDCSYNGTSIPTLGEMDKTVNEKGKSSPREEVFREITGKMADVYAAKNHDYGNSFLFTRERYPNAILIRLFDKLNRLDTLIDGESAKVDESIDDTLVDLANYAVMELVERRMEERKK